MKIILLKDIKRFGQKGEVHEVSDGYASSYLIPRGMAKVATKHDEETYQQKKEAREQQENNKAHEEKELFKKLNKKNLEIPGQVNTSGKLFKSIGVGDICAKLPGLKPGHLKLKKPLKEVGQHSIDLVVGKQKGHITVHITH